MKETESIFGRNVLFIKAAMPEIEKQKLKLELYRVSLFEDTDSVTVLLIDKGAPRESHKGDPGKIPAYEIKLSRENMKVLRANFVR